MEISDLQASLRQTYVERDAKRGRDATFRWLTEEVGELARALRTGDEDNLAHEFGDVFAWLASLANLTDVSLEDARRVAKRVLSQSMTLTVLGPFAQRDLAGVMA